MIKPYLTIRAFAIILFLLVLLLSATPLILPSCPLLSTFSHSPVVWVYGATPAQFSSTNASMDKAFLAVQFAERSGGNITSLIESLNSAINLVQKAQSENATNPSQATSDLQEASAIAYGVFTNSSSVASAGALRSRNTFLGSVAAAAVILVASSLLCIYGDRLYRQIWLLLFKDHLVRRQGGE